MTAKPGRKEGIALFLYLHILLLIASFFAFSCTKNSSSIYIDFSKTEPLSQAINEPQAGKIVRFAIAAGSSSSTTITSYNELFKYIERKLGYSVELVQKKTFSEIIELLRTGEIDFAIISSGSYVQAKEEFGVESVVVPVVNGQAYGYSYVIVRADSGIANFRELKGKTYAFTHPSSTYGRLVPVYKLALMRETPNSFFSSHIFTYGHSKSIKAVEEGLVDGASVYSLVYDYLSVSSPEKTRDTKIIDRSPPYGINPVVISPHSPSLLKSQFSKILLNLQTEEEGQKILQGLNFDRFVLPDEESYQIIRKMRDFVMKRTERLKSK